MSELQTKTCPTCREPWSVKSHVTRQFLLDEREAVHEIRVTCAKGHEFRLVGWYDGVARIVMPELVRGSGMTEEATEDPCLGCGKPIDPGQAYLPQGGPRHVGCYA